MDKPSPGPGQALLKITAAGACRSDDFVLNAPAGAFQLPLPMTLGHEGVGIVAEVGSGVRLSRNRGRGVRAVGLRRLLPVRPGRRTTASMRPKCPSLHRDSAPTARWPTIFSSTTHATWVPLGDLDPVTSVALTDAGLTPYHAIKPSLAKLVGGTTAVVIGAGGLGHVGIQLLRALTPSRIIAVDVTEEKLGVRPGGGGRTRLS